MPEITLNYTDDEAQQLRGYVAKLTMGDLIEAALWVLKAIESTPRKI